MRLWSIAWLCLLAPIGALAQENEVGYAPPPEWVVAMPPQQPKGAPASEGPLHFTYWDQQVRVDGAGTEQYTAYRVKLLQPDALALGNINLAWMPDAGGVTVHHLRIIRDGGVINVLDDTRFSVFQPQNAIEFSILSGQKVANVQAPGLRVGDEVEFAFTLRSRERALPDNSYGLTQIATIPASGSFRIRLTWPDGKEPVWRASDDLNGYLTKQSNAVEVRLDDPAALPLLHDVPARFAFMRTLEFSDFTSWRHLSASLAPLFSQAARLPANSPVKDLAARIQSETPDALGRARAALQLVQDEVRYVFVGMNGGNLVPAAADTTWQRRYGDCKAKTVLLMALLAEMGIVAHPVAVNSTGGDGINEHLPNPQFFDHVMVQAEIGGRWYWLDGTRTGDLRVRTAPPEFYEWVLPLVADGADISAVPFVPLDRPNEITLFEVDARDGYDRPAKVTLQKILRGADALNVRAALASLPPSEAQRALMQMYRAEGGFDDVTSADWRFDRDSATLVLSATAATMLDWKRGDGDVGWTSTIAGAGFYPPPRRVRGGPHARAPWRNDPQRFSCHVTTIHLPGSESGWIWTHNSAGMDVVIGGIAYWRMAALTAGTMRTVMASRTVQHEISPEDADAANAQIAGFNNAQSQVYQIRGTVRGSTLNVADRSITDVPTATGHDWITDSAPCVAPRLRSAR